MAKQLRSGLLAACEDPRLFGFNLWPRQRELLEVVECGPRIHAWAPRPALGEGHARGDRLSAHLPLAP
jgi:hypothetical protein